MKITDIRDPNLFQRLVQSLFVADRGYAFQVVDDSGGDRGNDGYDAERGILYSIYCPEKTGPDSKYLKKLRADLQSAQTLRTQPGYKFSQWTVVTPFALREQLQATLRVEAQAAGLTLSFMADTYLEDQYLRHPHLRDKFPELEYPRVAAVLEDMYRKIQEMDASAFPVTNAPSEPSSPEAVSSSPERVPAQPRSIFQGFASPTLVAIFNKLQEGNALALYELERYRLEAPTERERLEALLVEVEFEMDRLNFPAVEIGAGRGLEIASRLDLPAEKAVFGSYLVFAETMKYVELYVHYAVTIRVWREKGFVLFTPEQLIETTARLTTGRANISARVNEAYVSARTSGDLVTLYTVLLHRASIASQVAFPVRSLAEIGESGMSEELANLKTQVVRCYEAAIRLAKALDDRQRLATAYSNYANDLMAFGEKEKALSHAKHALILAEQVQDSRQIEKTKKLIWKLQ